MIRKTECVEEVGMFGKGVEDLEWVGKVGNGWGGSERCQCEVFSLVGCINESWRIIL